MTDPEDIVDLLLAHSKPPAVAPDLAARIVTAAERPDRRPASPPPRPGAWRRVRRGTWVAVIAVNVLLASAVAAAIGGGARYLPEPIARTTHHIVERLRAHVSLLSHVEPHERHVAVSPTPVASAERAVAPPPRADLRSMPRIVVPPPQAPVAFGPLRGALRSHPSYRYRQPLVRHAPIIRRLRPMRPPWQAKLAGARLERPRASPPWRRDGEMRFHRQRSVPGDWDARIRDGGWGRGERPGPRRAVPGPGGPRWRAFGGPGPRGPFGRGGRRFR